MANINIFGSLWNNLSKDNEKIIAFGSQIYGNGLSYSATDRLVTTAELTAVGLTGWTSGAVEGNQYDINRFFKTKISKIDSSIGSINANITNIKSNYLPLAGGTMASGAEIKSTTGLTIRAEELILGTTVDGVIQLGEGLDGEDIFVHPDMHHVDGKWHIYKTGNINAEKFVLNNKHVPTYDISTWDSAYLLTNDTSDLSANCIKLGSIISSIPINISNITYPISNHLNNLYTKVNHITDPLRFMGTVGGGGSLPTNASKGDMWHLNIDLKVGSVQYYAGDDLVCVDPSTNPIKWDLLGANIVRIEPKDITVDNLESWANS